MADASLAFYGSGMKEGTAEDRSCTQASAFKGCAALFWLDQDARLDSLDPSGHSSASAKSRWALAP